MGRVGGGNVSVRWSVVLVCTAVILSGCRGESDSSYTLPRGATISIRISDAIATDTYHEGDVFRGALDTPIREGLITYVPLDAPVQGVVESSGIFGDDPPTARLALRLTSAQLPNGETIQLNVVPVVHESVPELRSDDVTIRTGLDVDLDRLLGVEESAITPLTESGLRIEIARESHLVFTLREEVTIPAP